MSKYNRGRLYLYDDKGDAVLHPPQSVTTIDGRVYLSPDDLRWLCLVAGPALLNELGKEAADGND